MKKPTIEYSIIGLVISKEGKIMNCQKKLVDSRGFTLIELLLSLTILGIVMIGSMKFFSQAYTYTNMNQKKTAAVNVARNALMYIEKENFIAIRDKFEKNSDEEISLYICKDPIEDTYRYEKFWKDETPDESCEPITVNNVEYEVNIQNDDKPEASKPNYLYYVPIKATVTWSINRKEYSTELDGVIKSEDIR